MPLITAVSLILPKNAIGPREQTGKILGNFSQDVFWYSKRVYSEIYFASMQNEIQRQILSAFLVVLRPMARILLRFGIGFREFSEIAKTAFVDVASSDYGLRGRPTNISRIAVMTGLTRKEVRRLRDKISGGEPAVVVRTTPMWDILHHWHADPEFLNDSGRPAILPFYGDEGSFSRLVKRFAGDIPPGAMRTELKRVGAIEEDDSGSLKVIRRSFRPELDHESLISQLIHGVYALLSNVAHNTDPNLSEERWKNRVAFTQSIRSSDVPRMERIVGDRIADFAESVDDVFMAYETLHEGDGKDDEKVTIAVGVFYFESQLDDKDFTW